MVAESKNARRKRLRKLQAKERGYNALFHQVNHLQSCLRNAWEKDYEKYKLLKVTDKQLRDLSEHYLKVCRELNGLRPEPGVIILPDSRLWNGPV